MPNRSQFGDRIRACRIAAAMSQAELAAQAGVSVRAISDLERGRTRWPHPGSVHRLADALALTGRGRADFIRAASRRLPPAAPVERGRAKLVPRQLPPAPAAFAGRTSELATLSRLLTRPGGTVVITSIGGTPGVGKTALALHWSRLVAGEFPDGQLYLNLCGSALPMPPGDAVRVLLTGLGVPPGRLPHTEEGQLNLYRSLLVGKRMLILLDNACDEAQVRPLLPGSLTCRVVVTSRNPLGGLTALDAAHPLPVDVLTEAEARDLLVRRLGPARVRADEAATGQVIKASACLPLTLSIVAARATARPGLPIAHIAKEIAHIAEELAEGQDSFAGGEPASQAAAAIRTVLSWSYRQLDDETARVFRLAGLYPGPDLGQDTVAALADLTLDQAALALATLADGGLLHPAGPGRYAIHDLLRDYAAERARFLNA